jgi:lysine-N-methylase
LTHKEFITPQYAESFRCIGSDCEDTCCHGWKVPVDRDAYLRYESLPSGPLTTLIHESLERLPENAVGIKPSAFAIIRMNAANLCPMLSEDRLCRIQSEHGAALLPHACATYPRVVHSAGGATEIALTLSCPEAARLVLMHPNLLGSGAPAQSEAGPKLLHQHEQVHGGPPMEHWKRAVRDAVLKIVTNREYPLWQRLFLLGVFCRRLDAILQKDAAADSAIKVETPAGAVFDPLAEDAAPAAPRVGMPAFLADFQAAVASGALRAAMKSLPADDRAQLDAVLQLAGLMLHKSQVGPRFVDCIHAFTTGIGNGPGARLESLAEQYATAYTQFFVPFVCRNPLILENLVVNTILRLQFPFGSETDAPGTERSLTRQFATLAAQFALIRGLLIGVAGYHGDNFSAEHIVHTVQAASKHFEHHPEFLKQIYSWLVTNRMDGARGLTILLNEPAGSRADPALPEAGLRADSGSNARPELNGHRSVL